MNSATKAPTLSLHQLSLYNVGRMSSEQVIAAFAARQQQFERIVADLVAETPKSRAQHHLIVGQRGMGKTMLLARIAAELRTDAQHSARFIPLVFAEEQYAVDRLSKFWLNCLDSLADERELVKDTQSVNELDATIARLTAGGVGTAKDDQAFAEEVFDAFIRVTKTLDRRPVLLVDNLQLVFERLDSDQQHSLRELLMRPGCPILVGASPSPPPQSQDYGAAFYDQFKVHYLRPLDEAEMRSLLIHLADAAQRHDVRESVVQHPARLTVLRQLTGGNPRTALTLFFLYAEDFAPSVFGDLEGLLDRVTPLYKARFEELTPQQQVVASAVADHWDPVTAAGLSVVTRLPASTISAQLDRLEKIGVVERTELFGEASNGYQLAERFFNIWFLMRSASRRQRREVEFLARFLESFYEPADRSRLARHLMEEEHFTPDRLLWSRAVAASLDEPEIAEELTRHAELAAMVEERCDAATRVRERIDRRSLQPANVAFAELRLRLMSLVPDDAGIAPEEFARIVLGDRALFVSGERERLAARCGKISLQETQGLLEAAQKRTAVDEQTYSPEAVQWLAQRLANGQIRSSRDVDDWNRAFLRAPDRRSMQLAVDSLPRGLGSSVPDASFVRIRSLLAPTPASTARAWTRWGLTLARFSRHAEAENAYRAAIDREPGFAWPWSCLGNTLETLQRYAEAERAYGEALARGAKSAWTWNRLGGLLQDHLGRYTEAEAAYKKAIACDVRSPLPWRGLGRLHQNHLHDYRNAAIAYREALSRDSTSAWTWSRLGSLLQDNLNDFVAAEVAFREAIACDPTWSWPWNFLGNLYCDWLKRPADADAAFDAALRLNPSYESAHQNRVFLRRDFMGEGADARALMEGLTAIPDPEFLDSIHLHEALFSAYDSNWGLACEALAKALAIRAGGFSPANTDDWLRASAVLLHLNYGAELLAFLEHRGDTARLRPWVEALRAHHLGDRRALQNVAPEIRTTAEIFYDGIHARLEKLPDKTRRRPVPKPKRPRQRRR